MNSTETFRTPLVLARTRMPDRQGGSSTRSRWTTSRLHPQPRRPPLHLPRRPLRRRIWPARTRLLAIRSMPFRPLRAARLMRLLLVLVLVRRVLGEVV